MMLTPERKRMMMVVTCLLSFLCDMRTEKVIMLVIKPRTDRATHTQPAASSVSELIIVLGWRRSVGFRIRVTE